MTNNDIIYLFGFSERMGKYLEKLLPILKSQINRGSKIGIIFLHDGVINTSSKGLVSDSVKQLINLKVALYSLIPDLRARGMDLEFIQEGILLIDYDGFVDIIEATPKIISWM